MLFSKAIKIKSFVNDFNQRRTRNGFAVIKFDCSMYSIGKWSVDLSLNGEGVFFSSEMAAFSQLLMFGGFSFWVGSSNGSPVLYFQ